MKNSADVVKLYKAFLDEVPLPKRSWWFRVKTHAVVQLFRAGEWAGRRITNPKIHTPLEQMYLACAVAGVTPDFFRSKLKEAFDAQDHMLDKVAKMAPKDGVVQ